MRSFHDHRCRTSENTGGVYLTGVRFPYISYKNKISHIFTLDNAIDSKTSHKPYIHDRNISWSFEDNLTSWRHMTPLDVIWAPVRFTTCQIRSTINQDFAICRQLNVLAFIWWVKHQNWTIFDQVIGFYFLLRNFPDFDRFWLILAQFVLTSSLFWNFFDIFRNNSSNWTFLPKI